MMTTEPGRSSGTAVLLLCAGRSPLPRLLSFAQQHTHKSAFSLQSLTVFHLALHCSTAKASEVQSTLLWQQPAIMASKAALALLAACCLLAAAGRVQAVNKTVALRTLLLTIPG
jgi:hypothetical protein